MKKRKTFLGVALLVAMLILSVGYAVINADVLTINGTATASPDASNFSVVFTGTPTTVKTGAPAGAVVNASITNDTTATLTVTGLTAKNDEVSATYTIENKSADLSAALSANVSNNNTDYFNVSYAFGKTTIAGSDTTTITVTAKVLKTPIDADQTADITVEITAKPVQPTA